MSANVLRVHFCRYYIVLAIVPTAEHLEPVFEGVGATH